MKYRYFSEAVTLALDPQKCTGCGVCLQVCPHGVFALSEGKPQIADKAACMECGACVKNCAFGALTGKSGVGCAAAIINGALTGTEPSCDCGSGGACC